MTDQSSRPKELSLEGPLLTLKSVKYFLKIESPKDVPLLSPQARAFYKCLLLVSACFSLCASCCFSQVLCASCCFSLRLASLQDPSYFPKNQKLIPYLWRGSLLLWTGWQIGTKAPDFGPWALTREKLPRAWPRATGPNYTRLPTMHSTILYPTRRCACCRRQMEILSTLARCS